MKAVPQILLYLPTIIRILLGTAILALVGIALPYQSWGREKTNDNPTK